MKRDSEWHNNDLGPGDGHDLLTSTAMFRGDHLFSAKSTGELVCVEASTGEQVWETDKVTDLRNGASIHLTPNGDSVLLYTNKGELIRAQLTFLTEGLPSPVRVAVMIHERETRGQPSGGVGRPAPSARGSPT